MSILEDLCRNLLMHAADRLVRLLHADANSSNCLTRIEGGMVLTAVNKASTGHPADIQHMHPTG
jgi:hypothetical protein